MTNRSVKAGLKRIERIRQHRLSVATAENLEASRRLKAADLVVFESAKTVRDRQGQLKDADAWLAGASQPAWMDVAVAHRDKTERGVKAAHQTLATAQVEHQACAERRVVTRQVVLRMETKIRALGRLISRQRVALFQQRDAAMEEALEDWGLQRTASSENGGNGFH